MKRHRQHIITLVLSIIGLIGSACSSGHAEGEGHEEAEHPVIVTTPTIKDVPKTQAYVCQIHSRQHIEIRALDEGYLEDIPINEGQRVRAGQRLFKLYPVLYQTQLAADQAELRVAEINLRNTQKLADDHVVSDQELAKSHAERDRAKAKVARAAAEYKFTNVVAPFDGIVGRQLMQQGSLIEAGDVLTTVSDNSDMWVYFNVPEADYLHFKSLPGASNPEAPQALELPNATIQLRLANGEIFGSEAEKMLTIESEFDNKTGNIEFRADFQNADGLLRHGQTGTLLITQNISAALVIPQQATFEILDKQYVFVVDKESVAHQRKIKVAHELEDVFVIADGLKPGETYVLEGVRQVRDGEKLVHAKTLQPQEALKDLKHHAE